MSILDYYTAQAIDPTSQPLQVHDEMAAFLDVLQRENVKSYLEIGVRYGGLFEGVMDRLPSDGFGVALDFPGGNFGDDESVERLVNAVKRIRRKGGSVRDLILGPSAAPEVVRRAAAHAPYDCVFIDADHAYDAVKTDFALYYPMGRLIVLHDIAAPDGHTSRRGCPVDVGRFWREIKDDHKTLEIVAPGSDMGIGVIYAR